MCITQFCSIDTFTVKEVHFCKLIALSNCIGNVKGNTAGIGCVVRIFIAKSCYYCCIFVKLYYKIALI